jgi:hypothetical protein
MMEYPILPLIHRNGPFPEGRFTFFLQIADPVSPLDEWMMRADPRSQRTIPEAGYFVHGKPATSSTGGAAVIA